MASLNVLTFDAEGRAVDFEVWLDDLQLFLQCDSKDGLSLFDLTSGASTAPAADADSTVRSQWLTRDAAARLAVCNHLPSTERAHFARYSSPTTAALSRLMLPYLFPDLAAFATVADLVTHLRTSDARYRAALPTEFLPTNSPPMYITLYYLVTRLPDSLSSVRDHFLYLCPTELTDDLLEERLAAVEKSILAIGASRGDRRTPFFEGCSPVPLLPSLLLLSTSLALRRSALRLPLLGDAAPARARAAGVVEGVVGEAVEAVEEVEVVVGVVQGVGESVAAVEAVAAVADGVEAAAAVVEVAEEVVLVAVQLQRVEALVAASAPVRPRRFSSFVSGTLGVGGLGVRRCFGRLTDACHAQFPDAVELPRWHDLLLHNVSIFDLDFDAILAAMYAFADITEGDCYLRVPPDPGTVAAALGASAAAALGASAAAALGASASAAPGVGTSPLSGLAPTQSFHTFTLDSGASRSFFRDSTTIAPLRRPVAVSLADPSGGPVLAHSSTVLPCPAAPSRLLSGLHLPLFSTNLVSGTDLQDVWVDQFTPGGQRVTHCTGSRTGRHLATFTRRPGSSPYRLTTAPPPVPASGQVAASSQVFAAASRSSMASRALVSGLPRSLPPLPPGSAPTCFPCVEGRQHAAPHSSFPLTEAPLQTLHMDVKGEVTEVLIDWIHGARRQLSESFGSYLPVLRLHSDRDGEFSSDLLRAFCRLEGIRQMFTLPASPQQNGITERRIGMVMDVARTSMIHATAPHFLWPFAVQYAAHQINLQPRVSLRETTPTLRWMGKVGDASAFRVLGSRAFVRDTTADKLSSHAGPAPSGVSQVDSGGPRAEGTGSVSAVSGGAARPRPYYVLLLQQVLGSSPSPGPPPPFLSPAPVQSQSQLQPASPLSGPSPYSGLSRGLTERRKPESPPVSPRSRSALPVRRVRAGRVSRPRLPPVLSTHSMTLRPSTAPQRVPLPSPPASSLLDGPDPESDSLRAASPTVTRFLSTAVTDPLFESSAACALVPELVDFPAACRLDYAASLVAESASASVCPPSVGGECALGTDVLEERQEDLECFAGASSHLVSMLLDPEGDPDALDIPTPRSYAEAIEGPYSSQVKRPPSSPPAFKARYVARGFSQRQGVDFFQTFSPTPKMTTLRVLLHVAAQRDYELHSLDFSTAFLQSSLHEEIWLRRPPGFTGSFPAGT
ncbi:unnamed protein product [Closterium sp. NIES-54]